MPPVALNWVPPDWKLKLALERLYLQRAFSEVVILTKSHPADDGAAELFNGDTIVILGGVESRAKV